MLVKFGPSSFGLAPNVLALRGRGTDMQTPPRATRGRVNAVVDSSRTAWGTPGRWPLDEPRSPDLTRRGRLSNAARWSRGRHRRNARAVGRAAVRGDPARRGLRTAPSRGRRPTRGQGGHMHAIPMVGLPLKHRLARERLQNSAASHLTASHGQAIPAIRSDPSDCRPLCLLG
jgi:hypothetical protein